MDVKLTRWQPTWTSDFDGLAGRIRAAAGPSIVRIDHIGSTSVPGMTAKDIIDVQVMVRRLPDQQLEDGLLAAGFTRSPGAHEGRDHVPEGWKGDPADWDKRVFRPPAGTRPGNVHVRVAGRPNARYALLFRDFLTHDRAAREAWALFKQRLALGVTDLNSYGQIKDPATDVLMAAAERWAIESGWQPPQAADPTAVMRRVVLISGAIGVGKSATLRSMPETLTDLVGEIAGLESDQFYTMIDPHWTCPPDRLERYYEVAGRLLQETALGFLRSGFAWVAIASNGHWKQQRAREFVQPFLLENACVHHISLDPGEEILRQRIAQRAKAAGQDVDEQQAVAVDMLGKVRQALGTWTHLVDNSQLTPAGTVQAIYDAIDRGHGLMHP